LNTAIDYIIDVDDFVPGTTVRAKTTSLVPAGKGVDVAVGVGLLGGRAIATGFVGTQSREIFATLEHEGVNQAFLDVEGSTRTNVTIVEGGVRETHFQTMGYAVSQADIERLLARLETLLKAGDVLVMGGSYPPGTPACTATRFVEFAKSRGAFVILDASGPALIDGIAGAPHMVKPNLRELRELAGIAVEDDDRSIIEAGRRYLRGVDCAIVSRGSRGVVALARDEVLKAWLDLDRPYTSAGVGSGDALVAALATCVLDQRPLEEALRLGVACGVANLRTRSPGRFDPADLDMLVPRVSVQRGIPNCSKS
jgi:1-phosphofructokinase family hexose kinase